MHYIKNIQKLYMYTKLDLGFIRIMFSPTLSWILVPLGIYLYYKYIHIRPILFNSLIAIAIIGTFKSIQEKHSKEYNFAKNKFDWQYYTTIFFHLILLIILKDFCKYGYFNTNSLALMLFSIVIIYFLPWWPYPTSTKMEFITLIIIINSLLYSTHYLYCNYLIS